MSATKKKLALLLALLLLLGLTACAALESADVPAGPVDLPVLADEFEAEPAEEPPAEQAAEPLSEPEADEVPLPEAEPASEADAEEFPLPETEPAPEADTEEAPPPEAEAEPAPEEPEDALLPEDGTYSSKEEVALYIHQYGRLPDNFITKKEAEALGWPGGDLEPYAPGKCIGGSRFGNYEGILPAKEGRSYTECDIDTLGKNKRGAKRIVFSNDGLIYYTEDHYESFELLYGEEGRCREPRSTARPFPTAARCTRRWPDSLPSLNGMAGTSTRSTTA